MKNQPESKDERILGTLCHALAGSAVGSATAGLIELAAHMVDHEGFTNPLGPLALTLGLTALGAADRYNQA